MKVKATATIEWTYEVTPSHGRYSHCADVGECIALNHSYLSDPWNLETALSYLLRLGEDAAKNNNRTIRVELETLS